MSSVSPLCLRCLRLSVISSAQPSFDYDRSLPIDVQETSRRERDGVFLQEITYATLDGRRNGATLVTLAGRNRLLAPRPAVLFVHWYGPPEPTSNRTQFVPDAIELARAGVVSLLIERPGRTLTTFPSASETKTTAVRSRK